MRRKKKKIAKKIAQKTLKIAKKNAKKCQIAKMRKIAQKIDIFQKLPKITAAIFRRDSSNGRIERERD